MTILGIGVDLVHLPRIANLIVRRDPDSFARRILSETEILQWKVLANNAAKRAQFLAVRWCVKEAAYKALYPTVKPGWKELSYRGMLEYTKPTLAYHPKKKENEKKVGRVHVSVSHDGEYVYSSVLVEGLVDIVQQLQL